MTSRSSGRTAEKHRLLRLAAGAALLLFIYTGAVVLVLNFRWIYRFDISFLKLETESGIDKARIWENYLALIRYNQLWYRGDLVFPSLPMSGEARIHFHEVKRIFDLIQVCAIASGILSLLFWLKLRKENRRWLKYTGILGIMLPALAGILIAWNWDSFFVAFHQLVFNNDYWLFDPLQDPVILILPDTYFAQCAVLILLLVVLCCIGAILAGSRSRSKDY